MHREQMDPTQQLKAAIQTRFSLRALLPWVIVVALGAACIAVIFNEIFSTDKVDMQDCVFSDWSKWDGCTNNECTGFAVRSRTVLKPTQRCTNQPLLETKS